MSKSNIEDLTVVAVYLAFAARHGGAVMFGGRKIDEVLAAFSRISGIPEQAIRDIAAPIPYTEGANHE